jgi:GT2 family glycosyltransferase
MSISAIVPVWNGRADLERLLISLAAQTQPAAELLMIDNGSTDGAPELAKSYGAKVIAMGRNAGFAAAVNRGIREAAGDWIAVLNSDVELASDYFSQLTASDAWFATGKILSRHDPTLIDGTYDLVCRGGTAWRAGNGRKDGPAFAKRREIFSAPWTAVLFRSKLFEKAGVLEEAFGSYLEDVDFGLRCAALGLSGLYVPEAVAWHRGSASLGRWHPETVRLIARNQRLIIARHYSPEARRRAAWPILVAQLLWKLVGLRHGFLNRRTDPAPCAASSPHDPLLLEHLHQNEQEILCLQRATGFDLYWRLYFLLTRGGAN